MALFLVAGGCLVDDDGSAGSASVGGKADVFGDDDRTEQYEHAPDSNMALAAQATGALVLPWSDDELTTDGLSPGVDSYGAAYDLCDDVRFREQPAVGVCSAFLVGEDLVMTAGHCISHSSSCNGFKVIFGYGYEEAPADPFEFTFSQDDAYECAEVVAVGNESCTDDYALLRLDRKVVGRTPLVIGETPAVDQPIALAGHPSGLPMKLSPGRIRGGDEINAHTDADAFGGNSGSPAVNAATGEVFGIHVCSHPGNFDWQPEGCNRPIDCGADRETCERWAEAFKLSSIGEVLAPHLGEISEDPNPDQDPNPDEDPQPEEPPSEL